MNETILQISNLSIGYANPICSGISAKVQKGELVGLVGKNGSGKTTLLKTLMGLQTPISGEIFLNSENTAYWNIAERSQKMAVVFSRLLQVPAISVLDLVALGRLPYGTGFSKLKKFEKELVEHAMEEVGITSLVSKKATELSDGQLQMAMIARALVQETDCILMDEPTSHLDIENQFKIFELINKLAEDSNKTLIVSTHQIELILQNASQLWWMDQGEFHAGFPEQIAYEERIFEKMAQNNIKFDYQKGNFQFVKSSSKQIGLIENGSDLCFWTKKALERNGFSIIDSETDAIGFVDQKILYKNHTFESIHDLMDYLEN